MSLDLNETSKTIKNIVHKMASGVKQGVKTAKAMNLSPEKLRQQNPYSYEDDNYYNNIQNRMLNTKGVKNNALVDEFYKPPITRPQKIPIPPKAAEIYAQQIQPQIQKQRETVNKITLTGQPQVLGQQAPQATAPANVANEVKSFLETTVLPITRKYGIPDAVAAGMYAAEGRGKGLGARRNNFFNINAIDENPNAANAYETPEAGVEAFAKLLSEKYAEALKQGSVDEILNAIEGGNYAGNPQTYAERANNGFSSYAEFIRSTPEYRFYLQAAQAQ